GLIGRVAPVTAVVVGGGNPFGTVPGAAAANVGVMAATPFVVGTGLPMAVPPVSNCTEPAGVLPPSVTVAVRVTVWPTVAGLGEAVSVVVVELAGPLTIW